MKIGIYRVVQIKVYDRVYVQSKLSHKLIFFSYPIYAQKLKLQNSLHYTFFSYF